MTLPQKRQAAQRLIELSEDDLPAKYSIEYAHLSNRHAAGMAKDWLIMESTLQEIAQWPVQPGMSQKARECLEKISK